MMEFFLSGSLPLIEFVICDVMSDMANKLLSPSLSVRLSVLCVQTRQRDGRTLPVMRLIRTVI